MEPITVEIGGRIIPLIFEMPQFMEIEETVGSMIDLRDLIIKGKKRVRNTMQAIRIMGNGGLAKAGEKADLTDEWLTENMRPLLIKTYQLAVISAVERDSYSEAETERNENEERDLVMEELQKKKDPGSSHTDELSAGD